jgi:hypothetical protein
MIHQQAAWEMAMDTANVAAITPSFEKLAIRLSAIGELAAAVNDALDLSSILKAVRKHARWVLDFNGCSLVIADEHEPVYRVMPGPDQPLSLAPIRHRTTGWAGWVLNNGQSVVALKDRDPDRFREDQDAGVVSGAANNAVYLPIDDRGNTVGVLVFSSASLSAFGPADLPVAQLIRMQVAAAVRNTLLIETLETAEAVVMSLARAVEAKDAYTEGHCRRLGEYGLRIGQAVGLRPAELDAVYKGGLLHDIGKIAIPEAILLKPGRLTQDEFLQMQEHVTAGVRICSPLRSLRACLPAIRHHHEHFAGGGYPDGLVGDDIPLIARIISVVDAYDAMTTTRPYRQAMPVSRAREILATNTGPQWDPAIVPCFLKLLDSDGAS